MALATEKCIPCKNGEGKLTMEEVHTLLAGLKGWKHENGTICKRVTFKNFVTALDFTNRIGAVAEEQGHHPDLKLGWGYVEITLSTHDADGLTRNDFIVAAKIDALT